jgi:hypothetical protein
VLRGDSHFANPERMALRQTDLHLNCVFGPGGDQALSPKAQPLRAKAQPMSIIVKLLKLAVRVAQYKDRIKLSLPGAGPVKALLHRVTELLHYVPRPPAPAGSGALYRIRHLLIRAAGERRSPARRLFPFFSSIAPQKRPGYRRREAKNGRPCRPFAYPIGRGPAECVASGGL